MIKSATRSISRPAPWLRQVGLVVVASLFIVLCAHITIPLPFTPVPLTLQNFAVLVVGLTLGSRAGFAALALYLSEGMAGLPVFNPSGPGGLAQLIGPTGGYLMAYPLVAFLAGWIAESGQRSFTRLAVAAALGEIVLFLGGVSWLAVVTHGSWLQAAHFGLYPFLFAEIAKILGAAGACSRLPGLRSLVNGSR